MSRTIPKLMSSSLKHIDSLLPTAISSISPTFTFKSSLLFQFVFALIIYGCLLRFSRGGLSSFYSVLLWVCFSMFRTHKVIYRRYAGLFFSLCVDIKDNELAYLECNHLFVEILDHFFSNVCVLDLVFNFHKAIIERMGELEKQE